MRQYLNLHDLLSQRAMTRGGLEKLMKIRILSGNRVLMSIYSAAFSSSIGGVYETARIAENGSHIICTGKSDISGVSRLTKISSGVGALSAAPPLVNTRFRHQVGVGNGDQ